MRPLTSAELTFCLHKVIAHKHGYVHNVTVWTNWFSCDTVVSLSSSTTERIMSWFLIWFSSKSYSYSLLFVMYGIGYPT